MRNGKWIGGAISIFVVAVVAALFWISTYHPAEIEKERVVERRPAPEIVSGARLKVMSWNVQYMAGKNYVFWYDRLDGSGPDERPSAADIAGTIQGVARLIVEENPDIVLLQEIDHGARRTDCEDQLERLLALLPEEYRCHASAFYWKAWFVPHPRIMGAVGMKLSTISKYRIDSARRHQLALIPKDFVTRQFNLKRAVLETRLPVKGGGELVVMNTHLDAFAQGSDTMRRQAEQVLALMKSEMEKGAPCLIGGDFNLLAGELAYRRLSEGQKAYYKPVTELKPLVESLQSVPALKDIEGEDHAKWHTFFPNGMKAPDRTIDYIFFSNDIQIEDYSVRHKDALGLSDHMPVMATFQAF